MGALRSRHNIPLEDSIEEVRKQIDNASGLALTYLLTFGVDRARGVRPLLQGDERCGCLREDKKLNLVMKPHGGNSGASDDIQAVMKAVNHPNFKIWYDAGNIIYYTGKDPIEELKPIAHHVTGFCAKDCAASRARS